MNLGKWEGGGGLQRCISSYCVQLIMNGKMKLNRKDIF